MGIITPYRSQIALIKQEIARLNIPALNEILIDTVERFQGSERDIIIYSFCVNYPYQLKFLSNLTEDNGILIDRKLNVAMTRARKQMFITGVPDLLELNPIYLSLIKLANKQVCSQGLSSQGLLSLLQHLSKQQPHQLYEGYGLIPQVP